MLQCDIRKVRGEIFGKWEFKSDSNCVIICHPCYNIMIMVMIIKKISKQIAKNRDDKNSNNKN